MTQNKPANKHTDAAFNLFSLQSPTHLDRLHNSVSTAQTSGENLCTNLATFLTFFLHMGKTKEAGTSLKQERTSVLFQDVFPRVLALLSYCKECCCCWLQPTLWGIYRAGGSKPTYCLPTDNGNMFYCRDDKQNQNLEGHRSHMSETKMASLHFCSNLHSWARNTLILPEIEELSA